MTYRRKSFFHFILFYDTLFLLSLYPYISILLNIENLCNGVETHLDFRMALHNITEIC